MFYSQARPLIRSGDIVVWHEGWRLARGPVGRMRVGVAYWLEGRLMVVAWRAFAGVQFIPASRLPRFDWIRTYADLNAAASAELFDRLGAPRSVADMALGFRAVAGGRAGVTFAARVLQACGSFVGPVDTMTPSVFVYVLRHYQMPLQSIERDTEMRGCWRLPLPDRAHPKARCGPVRNITEM